MGEITKSNPICQTGGVKNHVNTSFKKNKKINLTAMPSMGQSGDFGRCFLPFRFLSYPKNLLCSKLPCSLGLSGLF